MRYPHRAQSKEKDTSFLEALTNSPPRARLLRFLLREPQLTWALRDVAERIQEPVPAVRREAALLSRIGLVEFRGAQKHRLVVVSTFPLLSELRALAVKPFPLSRSELVKILSRAGSLQLVVASGVFLNAPDARVDLLVVATRFSEKRMESAMRKVEAIVGAELRWAGMESKEFQYRWKMFDRFLRDIFTQPHEKIVERIKL